MTRLFLPSMTGRRTLCCLLDALTLVGLLTFSIRSRGASETDLRKDATVEAVQRVMPCVVNIATETVLPIRDPVENLFREFFDPYHRNRPPNAQFSLGSGVIIDEEGFVLTNFHVVGHASRVWVKLANGQEYEADKLAGTSFTDVALVKIRGKKGEKFSAVK